MKPYRGLKFGLVFLAMFLVGCAQYWKIPTNTPTGVYGPSPAAGSLVARNAPLFVVYGYQHTYNRIGRAEAGPDGKVRVVADRPVYYEMTRPFDTEHGHYTNLIYRIHFPEIPFSMVPFHLTAGKNVGLLVIITLDEAQQPVLVTTVHTCGCYLAIVPTDRLPPERLPVDWQPKPLHVYGERLPAMLSVKGKAHPRLVVTLRPGVHRVMNLEMIDDTAPHPRDRIGATLEDMAALNHLPTDHTTTSFYYTDGFLKGHVKNSIKPWETLLLGWISLDPAVGSDKAYADPTVTDNPFYTSLKPWNRNASDMWYFARFLKFWGWRL